MKRILISFCLLALGAMAEEPQKLLDSIRAELRDEINALPLGKAAPEEMQHRFQLQNLLAEIAPDDSVDEELQSQQTLRMLYQVQAISASKKLNDLCQSLITELRERTVKGSKALKEKVSSAIHDNIIKGLDATHAKELDAPLSDLDLLMRKSQMLASIFENRQMPQMDILQAAQQTLVEYQNALIAAENPDAPRSRNYNSPVEAFRQIAVNHSNSFSGIIPRSEFLGKVNSACQRLSGNGEGLLSQEAYEKKISELTQGIKKLEDIETVLSKINDLVRRQREFGGYYGDTNTANILRLYGHTYKELSAGEGASLSFTTNYNSSSDADTLSGVKNLLIRFALPRVLKTGPDLVQKDDEGPVSFLQRVLAAAQSNTNWPLLARVMDTAQTLGMYGMVSSSDSGALHTFLGAVNEEQASYRSGAVASYLAALRTGSQVLPVDYIGKRLAALKKESPEEFDAGTKMPPTPPTPVSTISDPRFTRTTTTRLPSIINQSRTSSNRTLVIPAQKEEVPVPSTTDPFARPESKPEPKR